jgi:hypothetical protein
VCDEIGHTARKCPERAAKIRASAADHPPDAPPRRSHPELDEEDEPEKLEGKLPEPTYSTRMGGGL